MRFAFFVQSNVGTPVHVRVEHPIDDEQRALDAADFAQRRGELMLARIRSELAQQLARSDGPGDHGGGASQDVGPVCRDQSLANPAADELAQLTRNGAGVKDMETFRWQVPDPGDELVSEECRRGEDPATLVDKAPDQILVRPSLFGLSSQPRLQGTGDLAGEGLVSIDPAQECQMFMAGLLARRVWQQVIRRAKVWSAGCGARHAASRKRWRSSAVRYFRPRASTSWRSRIRRDISFSVVSAMSPDLGPEPKSLLGGYMNSLGSAHCAPSTAAYDIGIGHQAGGGRIFSL